MQIFLSSVLIITIVTSLGNNDQCLKLIDFFKYFNLGIKGSLIVFLDIISYLENIVLFSLDLNLLKRLVKRYLP